jgi:hypothetical protein
MISAMMLTAISAGVLLPMSSPMGEYTRSKCWRSIPLFLLKQLEHGPHLSQHQD